MSATLLSLLVWLPFLLLAVTFGIVFAFLGYQRGSAKAGISLAVTLISTLLSVLLAKLVAGIFASSLAPAVRNLLGDYAEMMSGEHFSALVTGCASAAVSLVLFIPCFILVLILFKNLTSCVFTKKMPAPKKAGNKIGGLAIGIADALLLSFLLLLPLYGTLNLGSNVYGVITELTAGDSDNEEALNLPILSLGTGAAVRPVGAEGSGMESGNPSYNELLDALLNTPLSDIAGLPVFNDIYNNMASFTAPDGETVSVTETASTVTKVASAVISYKNGEEGSKDAMISAMDHLEQVMTESSFFAGLACDVVSVAVGTGEDALPIQYAGLTDKTVLQQDMKAIFTVARAAVESDLLGELISDEPDLTKVDVKAFSSGIATALNSTESIAQLKADLLNTVIDVAIEGIAGDDEEKRASLRESIGTVDAAPLTGDALAAEGDSLYLIMNAALTIAANGEDSKLSDTSKAAGDLIEGLARHPSFGVDKVVDVAGEILDMSGTTDSGNGSDDATKEAIKETLKDALNNSVSKPVGEATFGEFVGTTASAAEILTQIQSGSVDVKTMEQILNARPDVLQQLEETLTGELLTSLGLEGEASDIMVSLAHALFGALRENDMTAEEKKAEAVVLSDALALIFNMKNIQEGEVEATARTLVNAYLESKIVCATAKSLADKGSDPFGLEISEDDKAEIRPVFLQAIEEFSAEDPDAGEKIGYLSTLIGVELN